MSDNGSNMQPVRPLTRREMREREQAAAAERAAQQPGGPPAPDAPSGASWAPAQPARPAPQPAPPPSRRTLRETAPAPDFSAPPSVVRPPAASGGMRGLDETGRLTPVQETAERVTIRPPAPTPAVPTRTSSRPPAGVQRPGASGPVRPATPAGGSFPSGSGRTPAPAPAPPTPPPATPPFGASGQPQRMSAFAGSTGSTTAPSPAEASPSPWGATQVQPAAQVPPVAPARPAAPEPAPAEPSASLPWSAITSGDAPEPARPAPSPFGTTAAAAAPAAAEGDLFPRTQARAAEEHEEDDAHEEARGPSYTWLHYLILVAVAFVLGLLVWELISRDSSAPSTDAAATVVTVDGPASAWGAGGPLDSGR